MTFTSGVKIIDSTYSSVLHYSLSAFTFLLESDVQLHY